jgi:hypothetical protein
MAVEVKINRNEDEVLDSIDFGITDPDIEPDIHRVYKGLRYTAVGKEAGLEGVVLDEILSFLGLEYIGNDKTTDYYYELWRDTDYVYPLTEETAPLLPVEAGVGYPKPPDTPAILPVGSEANLAPQSAAREGSGGQLDPSLGEGARKCVGCGATEGLYTAQVPNPLMQNRPLEVYVCIKCFNPATGGTFKLTNGN